MIQIILFIVAIIFIIFWQTADNNNNRKIAKKSKKKAMSNNGFIYYDSKGKSYYVNNDKPCAMLHDKNGDLLIVSADNISEIFLNISHEKRKIEWQKIKNKEKKGKIITTINQKQVGDWYLCLVYIGIEIDTGRFYQLEATRHIPASKHIQNSNIIDNGIYYWLGFFDSQIQTEPEKMEQITKKEYLLYGGMINE